MTAFDAIRAVALRLIQQGVGRLAPVLEGTLPMPVEVLLRGVMEIPGVQAEVDALEGKAADEVEHLAELAKDRLVVLIEEFLSKHPVLGALFAKLEGSPILGQVLKFGEDFTEAQLMKCLFRLQKAGRWGEVISFFQGAGVLP